MCEVVYLIFFSKAVIADIYCDVLELIAFQHLDDIEAEKLLIFPSKFEFHSLNNCGSVVLDIQFLKWWTNLLVQVLTLIFIFCGNHWRTWWVREESWPLFTSTEENYLSHYIHHAGEKVGSRQLSFRHTTRPRLVHFDRNLLNNRKNFNT